MGLVTSVSTAAPAQWAKNLFGRSRGHLLPAAVHPQAGGSRRLALFCPLSAHYLRNEAGGRKTESSLKRHHRSPRGRCPAGSRWGSASPSRGELAFVRLGVTFAWRRRHGLLLPPTRGGSSPRHLGRAHGGEGLVLERCGAVAVDADIGWLLICTVLIAVFLALGKRRPVPHLRGAPPPIAHPCRVQRRSSTMFAVVTASAVTAYALYTCRRRRAKFHTGPTAPVPFCVRDLPYSTFFRRSSRNPADLSVRPRDPGNTTCGRRRISIYGGGTLSSQSRAGRRGGGRFPSVPGAGASGAADPHQARPSCCARGGPRLRRRGGALARGPRYAGDRVPTASSAGIKYPPAHRGSGCPRRGAAASRS